MGIDIYLWGMYVGALVQTPQGVAFQYTPEFRRSGLEISPVYLPLAGKEVFVNEPLWKATGGIPGCIYDALTDRFGNNLLMTYFNEKGLTESDIDVFAKLQYIGSRGMGALEFKPAMETDQRNDLISMEEIEQISVLGTKGKVALQTNMGDHKALLHILHIGTSAGGARAKALIAINKTNGDIRSGQLDLGNDFGYYLIKIDGANQDRLNEPSGFGKLEYSYSQMARDCGIQMMECTLYNGIHFMTRRFDRDEDGGKVHIHSLCGLLGLDYNSVGEYSYDQYFMAAMRIGLGMDSLEEIYRRMVFNVLAHNCDDHTKNFSFSMDRHGVWSLSPAYDLCYSYNSSNEWVNGHNMRINGKRKNIIAEDLLVVGERFNIKKRKSILSDLIEVISSFTNYAEKNEVSKALIEEVEMNRPKLKL